MNATKTIIIRCRAFASEGVRENKVRVESDGRVWVYDSVAGHYTTCHSLGRSALARIRRKASFTRPMSREPHTKDKK